MQQQQQRKYDRRHPSALHPALALTIVFLQLGWVGILFAIAVWKVTQESVLGYFTFFTNWSWTLYLVYFFISFPAPLVIAFRDRSILRTYTVWVVGLFFPLVWGVAWLVLILVVLLLLTGSDFLQKFLASVPLSLIVLGNEAYHVVPVIALIFYLAINSKIVFFSLNHLLTRPAAMEHWLIKLGTILYIGGGSVVIFALLYETFFDFQVVYDTHISVALGWLFILIALAIVNMLPLLAAIAFLDLASVRRSNAWLEHGSFDDY